MEYTHNTQGKTCTSTITVNLDDKGILKDLAFSGGGCQGNLKALRGILLGKEANWIINQFKGIPCGNKGTSCANELALCLEKALECKNTPNPKNCYFWSGLSAGTRKHECIMYNDICEDHLNCTYRTNPTQYHETLNRIQNSNSIL